MGAEVGTAEHVAAAAKDWRIRGQGCMPPEPGGSAGPEDNTQTYSMRYGGHVNKETVKDVSFVGPRDEVLAAGSDNGCMYLWDRHTGEKACYCTSCIWNKLDDGDPPLQLNAWRPTAGASGMILFCTNR